VLKAWHVDPTTVRTFDIELAKHKLDAAGYKARADGFRFDKQGKPINLRLVMPDSDPTFAKDAQYIVEWFRKAGINVTAKAYDQDALIDLVLPPEAGDPAKYKADYDLFIWTWSWGPDPSDPLQVFTCDQIGSSSDSLWCDRDYDALYRQQLAAPDDAARLAIVAQMQQLWYDQAPYHILYYDDDLHAYRTDTFAGWQNQPSDGTPLFSYSVRGETLLTDATAAVSPSPVASLSPAAPSLSIGPSTAPSPTPPSNAPPSTSILLAVIAMVVVAVLGLALLRRRQGAVEQEQARRRSGPS
jgi:peptide/nickel transport system substrate-binding protein